MAVDYNDNRITATSNDKSVHVKSVRLLASDFATGGVASVKAVLPAAATILSFHFWKRTQLTGGGITAATLSIGVPGSPTSFVNAFDALTPAAGAQSHLAHAGSHQNYNVPLGGDILLQFTGTATTGNPTAGEIYVDIYYAQ